MSNNDKLEPVEVKASAQKVTKPEKEKKPVFGKVKRWIKELRSEAKKVVWPTKKQIVNNTLVVLATLVVVGAVIWIADFLLRNGYSGLIELLT